MTAHGWGERFCRLLGVRREEAGAALAGFAFFYCLFTGYFMLRPLRETMGVTAGVDRLQWLFSATFVVMLLAAFAIAPDNVWSARVFFVWLSVFNLFVVSVAWSLMADVFRTEQAKRLFAFIAAGASFGGLSGPLFGGLLVGLLQPAGLMVLAALLLGLTLLAKRFLMGWRAVSGAGLGHSAAEDNPQRPMGGNPFSGALRLGSSWFLAGVGLFVVLLATTSTFLYLEQARLVAQLFQSTEERVRIFSLLDFVVQILAVLTQLFFTGRMARRLGLCFLLGILPLLVCVGFLLLAWSPGFFVLAAVMVLRRAGEYALIRPGREMLFTTVDVEAKYKVKNFIDTVVYRGGDAAGGWLKAGVDGLGYGAVLIALVGAFCAALWSWLGFALGLHAEQGKSSEERLK